MDPVFIVAVPRSGTTMLRMILNSHPNIYSGGEAPWLGGNYVENNSGPEVSIRGLYERMVTGGYSLDKGSADMDTQDLKNVFRSFVENIMKVQMKRTDKKIWVEKTPDNIVQIPFLQELFPKAKFIHIVRDGRDVALSTINVNWRALNFFIDVKRNNLKFTSLRKSINWQLLYKLPKNLQDIFLSTSLEPPYNRQDRAVFYPIANTYYNALYRWRKWIKVYEADAKACHINQLTVKYEDLLLRPHETFPLIFDFIGADWNENVLAYSKYHHDYIRGDVGSSSALKFPTVDPGNLYKWKKKLNSQQKRVTRKYFDDALLSMGYEKTC